MPLSQTLANADEEVAQGRLWRAKEILHSSISNYGYEPKLFRKLGDVLMLMGDTLEAGKYYFVSIDEPDEQQKLAIDLFLSRFSKPGYQALLCTLPSVARFADRQSYPAFAQQTLIQRGAPETFELPPSIQHYSAPIGFDYFYWIGCLPVLFLVLFSCVVGCTQMVSWVIAYFK